MARSSRVSTLALNVAYLLALQGIRLSMDHTTRSFLGAGSAHRIPWNGAERERLWNWVNFVRTIPHGSRPAHIWPV